MSDDLETVNAKSLREYGLIKRRGEGEAAAQAKERFVRTVVSPELIREVVEQVSREFGVVIRVSNHKPLMIAEFKTAGLKSYGKVYEIEKHAKALAEAWKKIRDMAQDAS